MSKDLVALGIILLVALPPILFNIFMRVVRRKPFRAIIPYMIGYVIIITALPSWYIRVWWWGLIVLVSVVGTWVFLSGFADLEDAARASRERRRKM